MNIIKNYRFMGIFAICASVIALAGCSYADKSDIESIGSPQQNELSVSTPEPSENIVLESEPQETEENKKIYTVKSFLQTALEPVGSTLYVYGGGWNEEDTGAGESAVTIGLSPRWREFYESMDADYDSSEHRYEIENGLDCTGYIGWAIYNLFNTENGNSGYVFFAKDLVSELSSIGFGSVIPKDSITDRQPGDIMGSSTAHHAWITIGECGDGSVVLLHASPPGVGLCAASYSGSGISEADEIVKYYMSKYYPDYYSRYPISTRGSGYLTDYDCFRWSDYVLSDPDGYRNMTPDQVLADLFGEF